MFDELDILTTLNLKKLCRAEKIPNYSKLKKKELLFHIKKYRIQATIDKGIIQLQTL